IGCLPRDAALALGADLGGTGLRHRLQFGSLLFLVGSLSPGLPDIDEHIAADAETDQVANLPHDNLAEELQQPEGGGHGRVSRRQDCSGSFTLAESRERHKERAHHPTPRRSVGSGQRLRELRSTWISRRNEAACSGGTGLM